MNYLRLQSSQVYVRKPVIALIDEYLSGKRTFTQVIPRNVGFEVIALNLEKADLSGACLPEIGLSRANLSECDLCYARLQGADLSETILLKARLLNADLFQANLNRANLREACLVGANLQGARLTGANLSKTDFREADLSDADLRGAIFFKTIMPDGTVISDSE